PQGPHRRAGRLHHGTESLRSGAGAQAAGAGAGLAAAGGRRMSKQAAAAGADYHGALISTGASERVGAAQVEETAHGARLVHGGVVGGGVGCIVGLDVEGRLLAEKVQHRAVYRQLPRDLVLPVQIEGGEVPDVAPVAEVLRQVDKAEEVEVDRSRAVSVAETRVGDIERSQVIGR